MSALDANLSHLEPQAADALSRLDALATLFEKSFESLDAASRGKYDAHYAEERATRDANTVRDVFERQRKNIESRVGTIVLALVTLKTTYVNEYGFSADPSSEGFEDFAAERDHWKESGLPDYRRRIEEA